MTTTAQKAASAKYDRTNTRQISLKLNRTTDADILAMLDAQASVQGYIKRLVREDIARVEALRAEPIEIEVPEDAPRFSTIGDAIAYVETALGDFAGDYDVEAIAREVTDWVDGRLTLVRDGDEFWAVVAEHDLTA